MSLFTATIAVPGMFYLPGYQSEPSNSNIQRLVFPFVFVLNEGIVLRCVMVLVCIIFISKI